MYGSICACWCSIKSGGDDDDEVDDDDDDDDDGADFEGVGDEDAAFVVLLQSLLLIMKAHLLAMLAKLKTASAQTTVVAVVCLQ